MQQGFGKYLVLDASYFWKYTQGDYDFDVLFNTPLSFPIQWKKSKIDGVALRLTMPTIHGWSAYSAMGHTRSRFFGPETGGILFNSPVDASVFRIDHDQAFQQNTHVMEGLQRCTHLEYDATTEDLSQNVFHLLYWTQMYPIDS